MLSPGLLLIWDELWLATGKAAHNATLSALQTIIELTIPTLLTFGITVLLSRQYSRRFPDINSLRTRSYLLSFAFLGMSLGLLTGYLRSASTSDNILDKLIPPLTTLIATAIGWVVRKDVADEMKLLVPPAIALLLLSFLYSFFYGNYVR